jgi:charged multivesicular body protein 3
LEKHTQKSKSELKTLAKKNDVKSARILAREVVRANKQRDRLVSSKARVGSVQMQLQNQLGGSFRDVGSNKTDKQQWSK